jgi:NAD(P)H-nitrite reductase large subunit
MPYLMNMQLDPEAGAILKKSVESLGSTSTSTSSPPT